MRIGSLQYLCCFCCPRRKSRDSEGFRRQPLLFRGTGDSMQEEMSADDVSVQGHQSLPFEETKKDPESSALGDRPSEKVSADDESVKSLSRVNERQKDFGDSVLGGDVSVQGHQSLPFEETKEDPESSTPGDCPSEKVSAGDILDENTGERRTLEKDFFKSEHILELLNSNMRGLVTVSGYVSSDDGDGG